jgi:hypothetical protein
LPVLDERFLSNLPRNFVLPASVDGLDARLLAEYGAVLVAGNGVTVPPSSIFSSEEEVAGFQSGLRISGGKYRLQAVAAEALAAAQAEAQRHGRRISPADVDAAGRSYAYTVTLWKSRVEPALRYWTRHGRLHTDTAIDIRSLTPPEQTLAIIRLEQQGMFFGAGFAKSILSSVSPPGTSQHLALLAFDVKEHRDPMVRRILERHGWYQTIVRDAPHFTYLGVSRSRLPSLGLMVVRDEDREYWIPRLASLSPTATNSPAHLGRGLWPHSQRHHADRG